MLGCKSHGIETNKYSLKVTKDTFDLEMSMNRNVERMKGTFDKIKSDTAYQSLYSKEKEIQFEFKSDIDSLKFSLPYNKEIIVNLEKDGMKPLVLIIRNGIDTKPLQFDTVNENKNIVMKYENDIHNPYLIELRKKYPIDSIASTADTDLGRVRKIASWVHNLWEHDGYSEPEKYDAMYILDEVSKGRRFRCVEYGLVTTTCLNSIGVRSRVLALKTEDVETRYSGAGHVVLEVFINDLDKWIMIDPQWDAIPHLANVPLNAVEFQAAVTNGENVEIWTSANSTAEEYIPWIYPYLYYFSVSFDNRENVGKERIMCQDKRDLMLVPEGAKNPTIFQQRFPLDYCFYTHCSKDFYKKPD